MQFSDSSVDTPQKVKSPCDTSGSPASIIRPCTAEPDASKDVIDFDSCVNVYYGPSINNVVVPLVDADRQPIAKYSADARAYFMPDKWLYKALKMPRQSYHSSALSHYIKHLFKSQCGKHTRNTWWVDKAGKAFGHHVTVPITMHGFTFKVLPSVKKIAIEYNATSLKQFMWCVINADRVVPDYIDRDAASDEDNTTVHTALSSQDRSDLTAYGIKWQPSKLLFMYGEDYKTKYVVKLPRVKKDKPTPSKAQRMKSLRKRVRKAKNAICNHLENGKCDEPIQISDSQSASDSEDADSED